MGTFRESMKKIERGVTSGYQMIEDGVTSGYQRIEDGFVAAYRKVEDKFVKTFLSDDEADADKGHHAGADTAPAVQEAP